MSKKSKSLLYKFVGIFTAFTLAVVVAGTVSTYFLQMNTYRAQVQQNAHNLANYLQELIRADKQDFIEYQNCMMEYADRVKVPYDFDGDYLPAMAEYYAILAEEYPGMSVDDDIPFEELSDRAKIAFTVYTHEYWLNVFEKARDTFGARYTYYVTPYPYADEYMVYIIDFLREETTIDGESCIALGVVAEHPKSEFKYMWEAWETGKIPSGHDVSDNEFGKTYEYYSPLIIDGKIIGVITVEMDSVQLNQEIIRLTALQAMGATFMMIICVIVLLIFLNKKFITRLETIVECVKEYTTEKNPDITKRLDGIAKSGDEIGDLAKEISAMILEINKHMESLVKFTRELTATRKHADELKAMANRDGLTGLRNKAAYDQEIQKLNAKLAAGDTRFGICMIDLNYLKRTNDIYGHDKGNEAIKALCMIVCDVFKHSPVFRVGGDEFVVVLRFSDYDDVDNLVQQLEERMRDTAETEGLDPWQKITAAIGVAMFDSDKDVTVEDVFRRADEAMYEKKAKMKAEGKA